MIEKLLNTLIIPHDKALHIIYGVLLFAIFNLFFSAFIAMPLILAIAGAKEIYDLFTINHKIEFMDIVATFAGAIIGLICSI